MISINMLSGANVSRVRHDIVFFFFSGAGTGLVPMYLVETAPVNIRGAMGVCHQFALTCGICASQIFGMRQILGGWFASRQCDLEAVLSVSDVYQLTTNIVI